MTKKQLSQIKNYAKPFYLKTGKYHAWDHIKSVVNWAERIAQDCPAADIYLIKAASYIHDIGRSKKDKNHGLESSKMIMPYLKKIKICQSDQDVILESVICHDRDMIKQAKSIEAKILFDADKLQIVTVFGFTRCLLWLVDEKKMSHLKAVKFLFNYVSDITNNYLQTALARKIAQKHLLFIKTFAEFNENWK